MEFPKVDFTDEHACFQTLLDIVHPEGLHCPRCHDSDGLVVHKHHGPSWIVDYRCKRCGRVFNAWTSTPFKKTHRPPSKILRIIQGRMVGKSFAQQARELRCHRGRLATLRHRWETWLASKFGPAPHKHDKRVTAMQQRRVPEKPGGLVGKSREIAKRLTSADTKPRKPSGRKNG